MLGVQLQGDITRASVLLETQLALYAADLIVERARLCERIRRSIPSAADRHIVRGLEPGFRTAVALSALQVEVGLAQEAQGDGRAATHSSEDVL